MTAPRTHRTVIGNDGELTTPIAEQTSEESLYASLPRLFLLDSAHAAYIAGKKLKPVAQKIALSWTFRDYGILVLLFGIIFLGFLGGISFFLLGKKALHVYIGEILVEAFLIAAFIFFAASWPFLLLASKRNLTKRRFYAHGTLLRGEVTYYKTKNYRKRAGLLSRRDADEIRYRFITPHGRVLNARILISHSGKWRTDKDSTPLRIGKPVAVLYVDDHHYMLL